MDETSESASVIPWSQLDKAQVPGGGGEIRLMRRGSEFSIMLGADELMNSRVSGSEEALATIAARQFKPTRATLSTGGVLAVWSSGPDPNFTQRLRKAGFDVDRSGFVPMDRVAAPDMSFGLRPVPSVVINRSRFDDSPYQTEA